MALEGTLHDMALSDLIQVFRMGPKTGILYLQSPSERGLISVVGGRMADAAVVCSSQRMVVALHDEAVLHMLLWDEASFVFRHDPSVAQRATRIAHESEWLILESLRRRDCRGQRLPYQEIGPDTRLQLTPLPGEGCSVSLDLNQWRVLSQISHRCDLQSIACAVGLSLDQTLRVATELLSLGMIEVAPPERPAATPRRPAEAASTHLIGGSALPVLTAAEARPQVGRGLLDAVMRRVRSL